MRLKELEYLNPKSILDIGANVGHWAKEAKEVWPDAHIFLLEGNPECKNELEATGLKYEIVLLSDKIKDVTFYQRKCGGTSTGDSIYRENTDWYNDENIVESKRKAYPLSQLFTVVEYDLWKIDCQGAELDILKGSGELVNYAKHIIMEVPVDGVEPYNIGAPTRTEYMEYMNSLGFINYKVLEDIVHPIGRHTIQQDILFSR